MMRIEITISPQGETRLETKGTAGPGCKEISRFLEDALGQILREQRTAEYYAAREVRPHLREGT